MHLCFGTAKTTPEHNINRSNTKSEESLCNLNSLIILAFPLSVTASLTVKGKKPADVVNYFKIFLQCSLSESCFVFCAGSDSLAGKKQCATWEQNWEQIKVRSWWEGWEAASIIYAPFDFIKFRHLHISWDGIKYLNNYAAHICFPPTPPILPAWEHRESGCWWAWGKQDKHQAKQRREQMYEQHTTEKKSFGGKFESKLPVWTFFLLFAELLFCRFLLNSSCYIGKSFA